MPSSEAGGRNQGWTSSGAGQLQAYRESRGLLTAVWIPGSGEAAAGSWGRWRGWSWAGTEESARPCRCGLPCCFPLLVRGTALGVGSCGFSHQLPLESPSVHCGPRVLIPAKLAVLGRGSDGNSTNQREWDNQTWCRCGEEGIRAVLQAKPLGGDDV